MLLRVLNFFAETIGTNMCFLCAKIFSDKKLRRNPCKYLSSVSKFWHKILLKLGWTQILNPYERCECLCSVWMCGVSRPASVPSRLPARGPLNSMYDTPDQLSLVWRATVPFWLLGTTLLGSWRSRCALRGMSALWLCAARLAGTDAAADADADAAWPAATLPARGDTCRAPGHAPPSRTTRTDTWCTGPAMSWERDVRVHTNNLKPTLHHHTLYATPLQSHYNTIHYTLKLFWNTLDNYMNKTCKLHKHIKKKQ